MTLRVGHFDIGFWSPWLADQTRREILVLGHKEHISWRIHDMKQLVLQLLRFEAHHFKWMIAELSLLLLQIQE